MTGSASGTGGASSGTSGGGPKFDVGGSGTGGAGPACKVPDEGLDAPGDCMEKAPADSFEPQVQWSWGDQASGPSSVIPLVANFTDDNGDLEIDLCDTPDVVLVTWEGAGFVNGVLRLFDGAAGGQHWQAAAMVKRWDTPAVGDVDGDGLVEIVTRTAAGKLAIFDEFGQVQAVGNDTITADLTAWALADLDADGDVEIYGAGVVYDHNLVQVASFTVEIGWSAQTAADLDGDGDLEILAGASAFHHDGTTYFANPGISTSFHGIYPQVADFDDDLDPEVLLAAADGAALLDQAGNVLWQKFGGGSGDANRPMAIHDFDGDGAPEFGASALGGTFAFGVYEGAPGVLWTGGAVDQTGQSGGTAFDFLGFGIAQSIYADEQTLWVYDEVGNVILDVPRSSFTQIEYPVVADVDNDGAAEILVVSNPFGGVQTTPSLQVIGDGEDRWVPARRIWNQHTYHVTNVREDGTIPQFEPPSWKGLNTFRTQAQAEGGVVCDPAG